MNRLRKWLPGVGLSLFSLSALCASVVTVHQPGKTWSAEPADTLSRLVTQPQLNNVWWQGAVIATPSATLRAQQTQQQVLASLSAWQNRADDERIATIRAVAAQI
ncbi:capsule biosynthesis GfcC D2 domain-containing protein, partial [Enterobacter cloacae complex sp. 3DZ3S2B]